MSGLKICLHNYVVAEEKEGDYLPLGCAACFGYTGCLHLLLRHLPNVIGAQCAGEICSIYSNPSTFSGKTQRIMNASVLTLSLPLLHRARMSTRRMTMNGRPSTSQPTMGSIIASTASYSRPDAMSSQNSTWIFFSNLCQTTTGISASMTNLVRHPVR